MLMGFTVHPGGVQGGEVRPLGQGTSIPLSHGTLDVRLDQGATETTEAGKIEAMCKDFIATGCSQAKAEKTLSSEQG